MSSLSGINVFLYTGEKSYAGTNTTVHIILYNDEGITSKEIGLNKRFKDDFECGQIDTFRLSEEESGDLGRFAKIKRIEMWKDYRLGIFSDDWFVEKVVVENSVINETFVFPLFRWIKSGQRYNFLHLNTSLPQLDQFPDQRKIELDEQKEKYVYRQVLPGAPATIKELPRAERYPFDHRFDQQKHLLRLTLASFVARLFPTKWTSFDDMLTVFSGKTFQEPESIKRWKSDMEFSRQRLNSINPGLIFLATKVPENFPVTDELLQPLLEGLTIEEAIQQKRLFMIDLKILEVIPPRPDVALCHPIAMFYVNDKKHLLPVAIQLFQKPGPDNPIFTPLDDPMLWLYVKMWYNNADAQYHESLAHLGLTHLIMEGLTIAFHRCISSTHPVYKLIAPHLLYLIRVDWTGTSVLLDKGGWFDKFLSAGSKGGWDLIIKGIDEWRMDVQGLLPVDLKARGVDDPNVLPGYYYRDDALLLFDAIKKYVTSYVHLYYATDDDLRKDVEIQAFVQELVAEKGGPNGGVGLKGVPGGGKLECSDDLVSIITSVIFTCSVTHAAVNFGQYDEYSYPPHYPSKILGKVPTSKNETFTEDYIVKNLPDKDTTISIMTAVSFLSTKSANSLGDFEVQYVFDPKARKLVDQFREDLEEIGQKIKSRNEKLEIPYDYLLPEAIPNSISA